jgi:hypothetical protein
MRLLSGKRRKPITEPESASESSVDTVTASAAPPSPVPLAEPPAPEPAVKMDVVAATAAAPVVATPPIRKSLVTLL